MMRTSCTNRAFARFVGRTYGTLHNERCLKMSVRPHITNIFQLFCADGSLVFLVGVRKCVHDFYCLFQFWQPYFAVLFECILGGSRYSCIHMILTIPHIRYNRSILIYIHTCQNLHCYQQILQSLFSCSLYNFIVDGRASFKYA